MTRPAWLRAKLRGTTSNEFTSSIREPPILVYELAEQLGVECRFLPDAPHPGHVRSTWSTAVIRVLDSGDSDEARRRQRHVVAQGLGHLLLHVVGGTYTIHNDPNDVLGRQALHFADALLMPRAILQPILNRGHQVEDIAKWFDVPEDAVLRRMRRLCDGRVDL